MRNRKYAFLIIFALFTMPLFTSIATKNINQVKPYTIMIYMNGSDLESDFGLATADLAEMLDSGLDSRNANVIILTGGTNHWMNTAIPEYECIIWELVDGWLNEVKSIGMVNMGDPATLRDFVTFSMEKYPAQKYGIIMWDHGGGSIAGFGHDEQFNNSSLSLLDMKQAFEEAGLRNNKLEFIGFDACLMATVEMAVLAADYAHVLIASEDLEPGDGWDYHFLSVLNETPYMDGFALGKVIVDTFIDFYGPDSDEILTLSVVDLSCANLVMETMGNLMAKATDEIHQIGFQIGFEMAEEGRGFHGLAKRRAYTKTFGEGSPRDNYADMVDVGDMAIMLYDLFPQEAEAVLQSLEDCVVYNRHNSDIDIWGLSTFYIYGGKSQGIYSLETYTALEMDEVYTQYLHIFLQALKHRNNEDSPIIHKELVLWQPVSKDIYRMQGILQTSKYDNNFLWPKINEHSVVLFPIASTASARKYAIPAEINNREVDIIVSFTAQNPQGRILGSRNINENVFQKGNDPILPGDSVAFYYPENNFADESQIWHKGETFIVQCPLHLTWAPALSEHRLGFRITNACNNVTYTTF